MGLRRVAHLFGPLTFTPYPSVLEEVNTSRRIGCRWNRKVASGVVQFTASKRMQKTVVNCPTNVAKLQAELRLDRPWDVIGFVAGLTNQAKLLSEYSQGVRQAVEVTQEQFKLVAESFEKTVAPLLNWAKNPRVKSELFMFRKSATGEKFSQLVTLSREKLVLILNLLFEFFTSKTASPITHRRAQIMSIRGLALSCAPNFTPISDINLFSRLHWGIA